MESEEVRKMLEAANIIRTHGHYVYASWKHGDTYVAKGEIDPKTLERFGVELARRLRHVDCDAVVAPMSGAVDLGRAVAAELSRLHGRPIPFVRAEKTADGFCLEPGGDDAVADRFAIVVEDVLNSGDSARKVVTVVRHAGGMVRAVGALVNRGDVTARDLAVIELVALLTLHLEQWAEADCPLCPHTPVNTELGHGAEYLKRLHADPQP